MRGFSLLERSSCACFGAGGEPEEEEEETAYEPDDEMALAAA
jgi:hypothetical protein